MGKRDTLTKALAFIGTLLAWGPIIFMLVTSIFGSFRFGKFTMDYMIPAEIFPAHITGVALLVWAALRDRFSLKLIGWGLALEILLLIGTQGLAVVTGPASGAAEPEGLNFALVISGLVLFDLAQAAVGLGGILLLRELFSGKSSLQPA